VTYRGRIRAVGRFGKVERAEQAEESRPVGRSWRDVLGCGQQTRRDGIRLNEHEGLQFNHSAIGVGEGDATAKGQRRAEHRMVCPTDNFEGAVAPIIDERKASEVCDSRLGCALLDEAPGAFALVNQISTRVGRDAGKLHARRNQIGVRTGKARLRRGRCDKSARYHHCV